MEEIKNEILSNINILEILNRLNYCNQGIKNTKSFISNTKFYNLKEDLLRFIIKNSETYKRTQLLTLFSEGEFETIISNIKK